MTKASRRTASGPAFLTGICLGLMLIPSIGLAEPEVGLREAERHFQRGVTLYTEADYHGALVEFNRAYTLAPNGIVLFNIGETQFQLRDYAGALATLEQYLVEAPADESHRAVATSNIRDLRTRVGRLRVVTIPAGATISIDDRVTGRSPLQKPIVVGIGQITVRAALPGRPPIVRTVDVAAEDDVLVTMEISASPAAKTESASPGTDLVGRSAGSPEKASALRIAGWVTTGVLASVAVTFGLLARSESNDLEKARREWYPTTTDAIGHLANRTRTLSIVADSFTAAALVVGGITLYSTLSAPAARVTVGFGSLRLDARF